MQKIGIYVNVFPMEKQTKITKKDSTAEPLKVYEVGYLLSSGIAEEKVADEVNTVRTLIENNGGILISDEFPKIRALAFEMTKKIGTETKKYNQAYFGWMKFEAPVESANAIKEGMETNNNVIRFLLIKTVRENTMSNIVKPISFKKDDEKSTPEKTVSQDESVKESTVEEIDKSIDELVIN